MFPHDDPMVFSIIISNYAVRRILVDDASFTDILFYDAFFKMVLPKDLLQRTDTPLISFSRDAIPIKGIITPPMIANQAPR